MPAQWERGSGAGRHESVDGPRAAVGRARIARSIGPFLPPTPYPLLPTAYFLPPFILPLPLSGSGGLKPSSAERTSTRFDSTFVRAQYLSFPSTMHHGAVRVLVFTSMSSTDAS